MPPDVAPLAERLSTQRPVGALGLVVGPAAFIAAWVVGGARTPGYSPVNDAISRIAAVGAPERGLMTAGFIVYGASVLVGSGALRRSPLRATWWLAAVNAAATVAVAATPLDRSETVDTLHGAFAAIGYVSITALPLASIGPLRRLGHRRAAAASAVIGAVSGACLVATTVTEANGLFQRIGLTSGDVWLVSTGVFLYLASRQRPAPDGSSPSIDGTSTTSG